MKLQRLPNVKLSKKKNKSSRMLSNNFKMKQRKELDLHLPLQLHLQVYKRVLLLVKNKLRHNPFHNLNQKKH